MRVVNNMCLFWGGEFSNWYRSLIVIDGVEFNTNEQYMMYKKALTFNDLDIAEKILKERDPREQKKLGRKVKNFNKEIWDSISRDVVLRANLAKFTQNKKLKEFIKEFPIDTLFVEASPLDEIWGIGLAEDDPKAYDQSTWKGTNWLGQCVTEVRQVLD